MGGHNGAEYQVFDISTESAPANCASLEVPNQVNDLAGINDFNGNAYAYVVTGDSSAELKVIRG